MLMDRLRIFTVVLGLLTVRTAHAGASLFVDDADITPAGRCQVESWARTYLPAQELTTVPACSAGSTEFSMGLSHFYQPAQNLLLSPGIKRVLHAEEHSRWGAAVSVGVLWNAAQGRLAGWNANLPLTFALDADHRTLLHVNLGWSKLRGFDGNLAGGLGMERVLSDRWTGLAELYADGTGLRLSQLGMRRLFGRDASLDLLLGHTEGLRQTRWLTLGFNLVLP